LAYLNPAVPTWIDFEKFEAQSHAGDRFASRGE